MCLGPAERPGPCRLFLSPGRREEHRVQTAAQFSALSSVYFAAFALVSLFTLSFMVSLYHLEVELLLSLSLSFINFKNVLL